MKSFIQILGWLGVVMILSAYFMVTFSFLSPQNLAYLLLNIFGSIFVLIETFNKKDYQPAFLNIIWAIIGIISLLRIF